MQEKKIIVEHSTVNLAFQVEKLIHEGWKIDEKHPFQSIGVHYECGLVKVEEVVHEKEVVVPSAKEELLEQLVVANDIAKDITAKVEVITNILEDSEALKQAEEARAEGFVEEEEVKELLDKVVKETKQEAPKAPVRQAGRPKSK